MAIKFEFISFTITQDEGDPFWRCSVELARPSDAFLFKPYDLFDINLPGELYHFYVNSVSISRTSSVTVGASVEGVGIGASLDPPRANPITKVWDTDVYAHDVVFELLGDFLGEWDFINWKIPGNRLSAENNSKIEIAKRIVEAAGGVLESLPSGLFIVRKKFPLPTSKYQEASQFILFDEVVDIESANFSFQNARYVDWVRVRDVSESNTSDRVETIFDKETQLKATIRVYPSPWRPVHLEHTGPDDLVLIPLGEVIRTEPEPDAEEIEELIEIFQGQGTTKYPVVEILTIRWHSVNLTSLYFDPYTTTIYSSHATLKNSLVYITYKTKSLNFRVESIIPQDVQFLVVED